MSMQQVSARKIGRWALAAGLLALAAAGSAHALEWNLQPAATKIAEDIHSLHEYVMALIVVIFIGVFGVMFYSIFAHRKSNGHKAANFHENTTVEIVWTVIPFALAMVMFALLPQFPMWTESLIESLLLLILLFPVLYLFSLRPLLMHIAEREQAEEDSIRIHFAEFRRRDHMKDLSRRSQRVGR